MTPSPSVSKFIPDWCSEYIGSKPWPAIYWLGHFREMTRSLSFHSVSCAVELIDLLVGLGQDGMEQCSRGQAQCLEYGKCKTGKWEKNG